MITKPQMLCALSKSQFELAWISLRSNKTEDKKEEEEEEEQQQQQQQPDPLMSNSVGKVPVLRRRSSLATSNDASLERRMSVYFDRQRFATEELVHKTERLNDGEKKHRHLSQL